jgi:hypothetical protein
MAGVHIANLIAAAQDLNRGDVPSVSSTPPRETAADFEGMKNLAIIPEEDRAGICELVGR